MVTADRIFTGNDLYIMASALAPIAQLQYRGMGELTNIIVSIRSIDDPYYMRNLSPATYMRTLAA